MNVCHTYIHIYIPIPIPPPLYFSRPPTLSFLFLLRCAQQSAHPSQFLFCLPSTRTVAIRLLSMMTMITASLSIVMDETFTTFSTIFVIPRDLNPPRTAPCAWNCNRKQNSINSCVYFERIGCCKHAWGA